MGNKHQINPLQMELAPPQPSSCTENDDSASTSTTAVSSAPSSPKGSLIISESPTPFQSEESIDDEILKASPLSLCNSRDPYADVRQRMESLASQDQVRHLHRNPAATNDSKELKSINPHTDITIFAATTTYLGYIVLIITGHIRDICARFFRKGRYRANNAPNNNNQTRPSDDLSTYAPLLKSWENFYTRRLYHRIQDCFNRPIASRPGAVISVLERVSFDGNKTMSLLGKISDHVEDDEGSDLQSYKMGKHYDESDGRAVRTCLNLGSYNYLGFADDWDVTCKSDVMGSLSCFPSSMGSSRLEFGTSSLHREVERIVASFVGKEDAIVLNMGFNTNATIIPTLTSRGDLIVSDELNHTSIVNGARASGASIRTFRHNDDKDLEGILREAIVVGQPRTRRPWNKILVIVEGIYSMEGEYCNLRNVVDVCKRYGAYVYLDEAHSIGAMGASGRGCCEYTGVNPVDVDVLMGTFTKSFGGMGGYVAANKEIVGILRKECAGSSYHNSLSPVVCQQIISSFKVIMGQDGTNIGRDKLTALRDNSNYFRMRLTDMGLHVLGNYDSPIMPVMLYNPTKIAAFSRECLKRGLAVVVVGFPAVPILMSRARFCISAGHTRDELDRALKELDEIADLLKLRYARSTFG
jgi:serine palmitoyltransferase